MWAGYGCLVAICVGYGVVLRSAFCSGFGSGLVLNLDVPAFMFYFDSDLDLHAVLYVIENAKRMYIELVLGIHIGIWIRCGLGCRICIMVLMFGFDQDLVLVLFVSVWIWIVCMLQCCKYVNAEVGLCCLFRMLTWLCNRFALELRSGSGRGCGCRV